MADHKKKKKKTRKNSNYKPTVKYAPIDAVLRKALCDYRSTPLEETDMFRSRETADNKYEKSLEFCLKAGIITAEEKEKLFDGKRGEVMAFEEVAEFTGLPVNMTKKNIISYKAGACDDDALADQYKQALCDIINEIISEFGPEPDETADEPLLEAAACYINFCMENQLISQDQAISVYVNVKQRENVTMEVLAEDVGLSNAQVEAIMKLREAAKKAGRPGL